MTKHTPGPWHAHHDHGWLVVESDNGDMYIKIEKGSAATRRIADARLIAAAPDLLAALQVLLRNYAAVHDIGDVEMQPAIYQASAAIAKATGEST